MSWSISEVARMTGLTSRTLRHYHAIGLLRPAWTADGGRRYYGEPELLRLQEILLLRGLGLGLDAIAEALAGRSEDDRIAFLRAHRRRLEKERERIDRLIDTVGRTITNLEEKAGMNPEEMFEGLIENPYESEARERWGDSAIDEADERIRRLSKDDRELLTSGRGFREVHERLAELKRARLAVDDPQVQAVIERHYGIVSLAWIPNAEAYVGLGQAYLSDERFRRNIGQGDDSLVEYLAEAMKVYADERLSS